MNDSINFANKLWEQKMNVYLKLSETIGNVMTVKEGKSIQESTMANLDILYYGQAILIEDSSVNESLTHFRRSANDYNNKLITLFQLKNIGMNSVEKIRNSIHKKTK